MNSVVVFYVHTTVTFSLIIHVTAIETLLFSCAPNSRWSRGEAKGGVQPEGWVSGQEVTRSVQCGSARMERKGSLTERDAWSDKDVQVDAHKR